MAPVYLPTGLTLRSDGVLHFHLLGRVVFDLQVCIKRAVVELRGGGLCYLGARNGPTDRQGYGLGGLVVP